MKDIKPAYLRGFMSFSILSFSAGYNEDQKY